MFKKRMAFVLGLVPFGVLAEQPIGTPGYVVGSGIPGVGPSAIVVGGDCYITGGVLSCSGANTDFVQAGNIASGKPGVYGDISYAGYGGSVANSLNDKFDPVTSVNIAGALKNENWLVLAPGSSTGATQPDGTIYIGGYIYNGTLDGATFDDAPSTGNAAVLKSRLVLEGASVTINGRDANGVAILNAGQSAVAGNRIITGGTSPADYTYAHSTVTAVESLSVQSNSGDIVINGAIWNNTIDGASGRIAGTSADLVRFGAASAQNLTVNGNVANFGGWANFSAGDDLKITGAMTSGYGTVGLSTMDGILSVGDISLTGSATSISLTARGTTSGHNGISTGALTIASGYGTFASDTFIAVDGNINVSGAGSSGTLFWAKGGTFVASNITNTATAGDLEIRATNGITANAISNAAGKMTLNPGSGNAVRLVADSITSSAGGTVILDYVSDLVLNNTTTSLSVAGNLYVGATTGTNGGTGDMYFTQNSGNHNVTTGFTDNTVTARGTVNITGSVVINGGRSLTIVPPSTDFINVTMGNVINNSGGLYVGSPASMIPSAGYGVRSFTSGAVTVAGAEIVRAKTTIYAADDGTTTNNITMGVVENGFYSDMYLRADDNISMTSFSNSEKTSGDVTIWAQNGDITMTGGANSGFLENIAVGTTQMVVRADNGNITTAGDIENSGSLLQLLAAGDITVGGTVKNDLTDGMGTLLIGTDGLFQPDGTLTQNRAVANLIVNGGDASNASLVNTGVFKAVVLGQTYLNWGVDLSVVPDNGTFYLDTGTFAIAHPNGTNGINDLFKNRIANFTLRVRNGDLVLADVINGAKKLPTWTGSAWDYSDAEILANTAANMYVSANNLTATTVANIGTTLTLGSDATGALAPGQKGHLWITSNVLNGTADGLNPINNGVGAVTTLTAAGILAIDGTVNNFATLAIDGDLRVILNNIINSGKTSVTSRTDLGIIDVNGAINNRGTGWVGASNWSNGALYDLYINAKEINLNGDFTSMTGTALVQASDGGAVQVDMKNLVANGGMVDIDAFNGVAFSGGMDVNAGLVNFSSATRTITTAGTIAIDGNLNAATAYDMTSGTVNLLASNVTMTSDANINVLGGVLAKDARNLTLKAVNVDIDGNVTADGSGIISFGDTTFIGTVDVDGAMWAKTGSAIVLNADTVTVGTLVNDGRMNANGLGIVADAGTGGNAIALNNGVYFDNVDRSAQTTGFIIGAAGKEFTLSTTGADAGITIGADTSGNAILINDSNVLNIVSADRLITAGNISNTGATLNMTATGDVEINGNVTSASTTNITGNGIVGQNITNSGNFNITSTGGAIQFNNIVNDTGALMNLGNATYSTVAITTASFTQNAGVTNVYGAGWTVTNALNLFGGNVNLYTDTLSAGPIYIDDHLVQDLASGTLDGTLNVTVNNTHVTASSLSVGGDLNARAQTAAYDVTNNVTIGERVNVAEDAGVILLSNDGSVEVSGTNVAAGVATVNNAGHLNLVATDGSVSVANGVVNAATGNMLVIGNDVSLGHVDNSGTMSILSGATHMLKLDGLENRAGTLALMGTGVLSTAAFDIAGALTQYAGAGLSGDVEISSDSYVIDLTNNGASPNSIAITNGIAQGSGALTIKTSSLFIGAGGIDASTASATDGVSIVGGNSCTGAGCTPPGIGSGDWFPWLDANITGDLSNGVKFFGIGHMILAGDYYFGDNSILHASVLPKGLDPLYNHYGTIGLDRATWGQVDMTTTNATPIINIDGMFKSDLSDVPGLSNGGVALNNGQFGVSIFDAVDSGTVIWLAHATGGIEQSGEKLRNVTVGFCNANGTKCFNYIDAIRDANGLLYSKSPTTGSDDGSGLPIYVMLRHDENGSYNPNNIYIVFNPEFGGPINVFKIQPEVDRDPTRTDNEYGTAGAIDDLVKGALRKDGFYFTSPIETIPLVFDGTNMETIGRELYNRMEQYKMDYDPTGLARFSRLFVPRELELIAGDINLIEHTASRSFASRMTDEFLWNRNRNLKKVWVDVEAGFFNQNLTDDLKTDGDKFTLNLGVDWRATDTTVFGLAGRVNHLASSVADTMDLSYQGGVDVRPPIPGRVDIDVTTTNVGIGAYMLNTFSRSLRLYGNVFLDMHMIDVTRDQNFISAINGTANAYSATTEWGLMHDISNQYFVGNLYVRAGYNTGFDLTEKAGGGDYMKLQSDGYFMLIPGYSVTMNKAFYANPWFKIRPYLTVGVEYDVLGMDDAMQYKFTLSEKFTDYGIKIDPLWASGQVGVEFLAVSGWQFGVDYEYKFNPEITLHNFRLSGSFRF